MKRIINYLKADPSLTIGIVILLLVLCYISYVEYMRKNHGAVTIAKVEKFESAEQGVNIYITIYFRGKQYKSMVGADCFGCEGQFFFIRIIEDAPSQAPILYPNHPVPFCVLQKPLPFNGWKEMPDKPCD